jgi:carotenoid 1,2-hydratase
VAPGGYVWWYLDALSDDGAHGLTIIAFVGSVFSPYYAHARHRRLRSHGDVRVDPLEHCALNVALYETSDRARDARWAMTERGRAQVMRAATRLAIGPSALEWHGDRLRIRLDEIAAPLPRRIRGVIDVETGARPAHRVDLDDRGRHQWGVIAPCARIRVALDAPRVAWTGSAYLDSNRGSVPLEHDFVRWDWSRAHLADGRTAVVYDIERRHGGSLAIADGFDASGHVTPFDPPPRVALARTRWGLERSTRAEPSTTPRVVRSFEDGPFYARAVVATRWLGQPVTSVHEQLSLTRFERRWVRALLPFRMPRRFF